MRLWPDAMILRSSGLSSTASCATMNTCAHGSPAQHGLCMAPCIHLGHWNGVQARPPAIALIFPGRWWLTQPHWGVLKAAWADQQPVNSDAQPHGLLHARHAFAFTANSGGQALASCQPPRAPSPWVSCPPAPAWMSGPGLPGSHSPPAHRKCCRVALGHQP